MAIVSLSEAKSHLKVDQSDEDTLIQLYIDAAVDYIGGYLNNPSFAYNSSIKAACLLIVGDLYENREAGSDVEIKRNPSVDSLLFAYRKDMGV